MTPRLQTGLAWLAIAAVAAISVLLDHLHYLTAHFNWFMAVIGIEIPIVVVIVAKLHHQPPSPD